VSASSHIPHPCSLDGNSTTHDAVRQQVGTGVVNPRSSLASSFEERSVAQPASSPNTRTQGHRPAQAVEEQYDAFLADYGPGDEGEAELEEDENRLTVRNRFKAAAARRGLELIFPRTNGRLLRFRVAPTVEAAAEAAPELPVVEAEPVVASEAPKRRGGRRKAASAPAL
jgi:hypothetical protein